MARYYVDENGVKTLVERTRMAGTEDLPEERDEEKEVAEDEQVPGWPVDEDSDEV